ncbi:MAG: microcystin-dependent protein [Hymenobacter sp.]|nr:microcystin-dependent protein [Hymenobacter sp.]
MSYPYIGEIRTVGFTFPPVGWLTCNGQLLNISDYDVLFNLIGTTYGGDGQTTFAVPNLQSRVNVAAGNGPGLSAYVPGQQGGTENVTLTTTQMPTHTHPYTASVNANTGSAAIKNPVGTNVYPGIASVNVYSNTPTGTDTLGTGAITATAAPAGGSQAHPNIQPVLALNCIICFEGIYPSRP